MASKMELMVTSNYLFFLSPEYCCIVCWLPLYIQVIRYFTIFADDTILNSLIVKNFTDSHGFEYELNHERMVNVGGNDDCALFGYMTPFNHTLGKPEVRCGHERYDVYSFP